MRPVITAICLSIFSFTAQASELKDHFISTTGMKEGNYELVKGDESCDEGDLSINDMGTELSLILGSRPLILGVGLENFQDTDRSCVSLTTGKFEGRHVNGERLSTCKKLGVTRYTVEIDFTDDGFTYTRRTFKNGKNKIKEETCVLKRVP